jgi:tripartite-type tricarboxylate transporter receptor subunit TctC
MKQWTRLVMAGALAMLAPAAAHAQAYPNKPVKIVVGFAPGGSPDVFARLIAQKLTDNWKQQVVVENRAGATGNIAGEAVARSAPDGYTMLYCDSATWAINPHVFSKMAYDPFKELQPVIHTSILPVYVTVQSTFPANNLAEFIAYAKQRPGKLSYGSTGSGSIHHLTTELFKSMTGLQLLHVPYKGSGPASIALVGGEVDAALLSYTSVNQHVASGKLRILAISTGQRSKALPNVPTIGESVPGFDMASSLGALVPAGTPRDVIMKIHSGIAAAIADPELNAKMTGFGVFTVSGSTPEEFARVMRSEYETFGKAVKAAGAKAE